MSKATTPHKSNLLFGKLLFGYIILLPLLSCNVVNKLFHKIKTVTDSTSVSRQKKDSIYTNDSVRLSKEQKEYSSEIIFDFGDRGIHVPIRNDTNGFDRGIYVWPKDEKDYFEITKDGSIKTNKQLVKVVVKTNGKEVSYDSLADHSKIEISYLNEDSVRVEKKEKDVVREVHKRKFPVFETIIGLLISGVVVFVFMWLRRKKKQIDGLKIPPL